MYAIVSGVRAVCAEPTSTTVQATRRDGAGERRPDTGVAEWRVGTCGDMASAAIVRSGLASEILLYQLHSIAAVTAVGYGSILSNGYLPDTVRARRLAVQ